MATGDRVYTHIWMDGRESPNRMAVVAKYTPKKQSGPNKGESA
jgi:hypothetical protein